MAYFGDYHTHTTYSHGKGTVEDNVLAALKCGFKEIAITDHGFHHMTYNVRRMDWPYIRRDVELMRRKYPMIKILLGLESNLVSATGGVDITPADMDILDILVCGYHKFIRADRFGDQFGFFLPNFVLSTIGKNSKRLIAKNTDAYIKMLEKYDVDTISHICCTAPVDVYEVAKAAAHYGTLIEINNKNIRSSTLCSSCSDAEWEKILKSDAEFIVDSDAHKPSAVGGFEKADKLIDRVGIPRERIANWERTPVFRSHKAKEEILRAGEKTIGDAH